MLLHSDEFKISQDFLNIIFLELAVIVIFFFRSIGNAIKLSFNVKKIDISSIGFGQLLILITVNLFVVGPLASKYKIRVDHIGFSIQY